MQKFLPNLPKGHLKETDLRVNFTQHFRNGTERTHLDKATLQRRLLLTLFGMGTNTGIKTMESRPIDDYKELLYVRRRFISNDGLRQAIAKVVNATLDVRLSSIWGEATTACASDSKQFGAWDQNLLTEWHVEKNALCIYSQFKRVSSSTRTNAQHPAYKAFSELGKAIKTIFLCQYLASENLRREINAGPMSWRVGTTPTASFSTAMLAN